MSKIKEMRGKCNIEHQVMVLQLYQRKGTARSPKIIEKEHFVQQVTVNDSFKTRYHEVYWGDSPSRIVLDIELEGDTLMSREEFEEDRVQWAINRLVEFFNEHGLPTDVLNRRLYTDCHREGKYSTHVIFPDSWISRQYDVQRLMRHLFKKSEIDLGIYASENSFSTLKIPYSWTTNMKYRMLPREPIEELDFERLSEYTVSIAQGLPPAGLDISRLLEDVFGREAKRSKFATVDDLDSTFVDRSESLVKILNPHAWRSGAHTWKLPNREDGITIPCLYCGRRHKSNEAYAYSKFNEYGSVSIYVRCLDPECENKGSFRYI